MPESFRNRSARFLSVFMFGIAAVILVRLVILRRPPATPYLALDLAFAAFFLLRGWMHLSAWRRRDQ